MLNLTNLDKLFILTEIKGSDTMNSFSPLFDIMKSYRGDVSAKELTNEFLENIESIKELTALALSTKDYIYSDMIESYSMLPKRISKEERRNFILGINFFHTSEILDANDKEMPVYDEEDLKMLIENRTEDLEYMIGDQYPHLMDDYTKAGISAEANIYYKQYKHFRRR